MNLFEVFRIAFNRTKRNWNNVDCSITTRQVPFNRTKRNWNIQNGNRMLSVITFNRTKRNWNGIGEPKPGAIETFNRTKRNWNFSKGVPSVLLFRLLIAPKGIEIRNRYSSCDLLWTFNRTKRNWNMFWQRLSKIWRRF